MGCSNGAIMIRTGTWVKVEGKHPYLPGEYQVQAVFGCELVRIELINGVFFWVPFERIVVVEPQPGNNRAELS